MSNINISELTTDEQLFFQDNDNLSTLTEVRSSKCMCVFIINFQTRSARIDGLRLGVRFVDVRDEG